jgi:hypothetical protein
VRRSSEGFCFDPLADRGNETTAGKDRARGKAGNPTLLLWRLSSRGKGLGKTWYRLVDRTIELGHAGCRVLSAHRIVEGGHGKASLGQGTNIDELARRSSS